MVNLSVTGSGYSAVTEERGAAPVYIHRLSAVAEHGFDAVVNNDVHHMELFDGRPCQWFNARDAVVPEDPTEHRCRTLNNVEVEAADPTQVHAAD